MKSWEQSKDQVYDCLRCGVCRGDSVIEKTGAYYSVCPIPLVSPGFDVFYPRGKLMLARAYLEKQMKPEEIAEYVYMCTNCNACQVQCAIAHVPRLDYHTKQMTDEPLLNIPELIEAVKTELASKGVQLPPHKRFAEATEREHNPYGEKHETRWAWLGEEKKGELSTQAKYVYFVGCTTSYRTSEIGHHTVELFDKLGIDFTIMNEWCCGSPLLRTGRPELFKELLAHNLKEIEKTAAEYVITSCAGCYRTFKLEYPKYVDESPSFQIIHTTELLKRLLDEGKLTFKEAATQLTITYHDPCHLGRHAGVYEVPREVLKQLPGITLIEMTRNHEGSLCCGSGGGVKAGFPDIALRLGTLRIEEALSTAADALVSTCPFCKKNFLDANEASSKKIPIYDVVELVNQLTK